MKSWQGLYPRGVDDSFRADHPTLLAAWESQVAMRSQAPAVHYFDCTLTFAEIEASAEALACGLLELGVGRGDRVAIYLQNDPQWLVSLLGVWKVGGVAVAINPMLAGEELQHHLDDSGASLLICLNSLAETAQSVLGSTSVQQVIATHPLDLTPHARVPDDLARFIPPRRRVDDAVDWRELLAAHHGATPPAFEADPQDIGMLTYTSGTTGRSKGAMNLQGAMAYNSTLYTRWWDLRAESDVVVCVAPVFHITGSIAGFGAHIVSGAPIVLMHRFDPGVTVQAIEQRGGTFMVGASTAYIALSTQDRFRRDAVVSLTKTLSGGAPVSQALVDRIRDTTGWTLHGAYGMTETNSPTHLGPPHRTPPIDPESGAVSVGIPVPGVEQRIVDPLVGSDLPPGQAGEIVVRGPMVIPGYWNLPAETAQTIRDRWLYTGDIGKVTEDGWLFVVDRLKDLINAGGYKVYPRDVEDVLYRHPAVREAAVVGVPDEYRGETVKAFVSLVSGETATPEELIEFCKERVSAYKYPRLVEILEELPKNTSGKLLRRELRGSGDTTRRSS